MSVLSSGVISAVHRCDIDLFCPFSRPGVPLMIMIPPLLGNLWRWDSVSIRGNRFARVLEVVYFAMQAVVVLRLCLLMRCDM